MPQPLKYMKANLQRGLIAGLVYLNVKAVPMGRPSPQLHCREFYSEPITF
jgi:hypothetical protein